MKAWITDYLESKKYAWSETTKRSEMHRLNAVALSLDGNPETLWKAIQDRGSYTRLTIWTRVVDFIEWLIETERMSGPNTYKRWKKENARLFKNVYTKKTPTCTYQDAVERIRSLPNETIRNMAFNMLSTGARVSEVRSVEAGMVCGKGGKTRPMSLPVEGRMFAGTYQSFRVALSKVGLKPHDLRKLFLSRLVELGANEFELCEIAGWESIATASSYIKVNKSRVAELVKKAGCTL